MNRKKILYIMGIDWSWIYQRPQIFAEKLTEDYEVVVIFPRSILKWKKKKKTKPNVGMRILWTIPFQEKNMVIVKLSRLINNRIFNDINSFQFIYLTYPLYARYIPECYKGKIIYDCMDNHEALYPDPKRSVKIVQQEDLIVKKCDLLVVSSGDLQKKMNGIAGFDKSLLVRNAVNLNSICKVQQAKVKRNYSICYIGTIAEWFDEDLLVDSLKCITNITYHLIGPIRHQPKAHPSILLEGIVDHSELYSEIEKYDFLIMPFKVNDIVESVDPVKLYEYIAFGKCIISVYYPEVEQFKDFVYFYTDLDEYIVLLDELVQSGFPPKYNDEKQRQFLLNNTWDKRYEMLKKAIITMEEK